MTGEITLHGRVLPIGGLKEKSLAAYREGIDTLLYPEGNRKDLAEIPEDHQESTQACSRQTYGTSGIISVGGKAHIMKKHFLLTPGPIPIPPEVSSKEGLPVMHHRTSEFSAIFQEVIDNLKYVFETKNDVFVIASSGTGALETAVCNLLSPGDTWPDGPPKSTPFGSS